MHKIRFKVNPRHRSEHDILIVQRVANIISDIPAVKERREGYRWELDSTSDWWMDKDSKTGEFILAYRHGVGGNRKHMLRLRATILWLLRIEHYNEPVGRIR